MALELKGLQNYWKSQLEIGKKCLIIPWTALFRVDLDMKDNFFQISNFNPLQFYSSLSYKASLYLI